MANYHEDVLFSSKVGTPNSFTLSGNPTNYDYLRVSYGSPNIGGAATTLGNLGPMMTVTLPSFMNWANLYNVFYGTVNGSQFVTPYRTVASFSGISGTSWTRYCNAFGPTNTYATNNGASWTHVYMVVGVKTGTPGDFHADLLYDYVRDGSASLNLTAHPSGYRRIGIISTLAPTQMSERNRATRNYQEYPYYHLTPESGKSGYLMTYNKYSNIPVLNGNQYDGALYQNCNSTAWSQAVQSRWFSETGGDGGTYGSGCGFIYQVIGIDRI